MTKLKASVAPQCSLPLWARAAALSSSKLQSNSLLQLLQTHYRGATDPRGSSPVVSLTHSYRCFMGMF